MTSCFANLLGTKTNWFPNWFHYFRALALGTLAAWTTASGAAAPISVYPEQAKNFTRSLNGDWSFKYIPSLDAGADADFYQPDFNVSAWKKIPVPSNWELQGFAGPHYGTKLESGLGLYRRTFHVPAAWHGRVVCLRFGGVAFGFEAWVNGKKVGTSDASAFNPDFFDITSALNPAPNANNVLAVRVTTKPLGWEFDANDDWSLSGIFRGVTLFSVPQTHVQDITADTTLTADGAADLSVSVLLNQPDGELHGKLFAPDGKLVSKFALPKQADGRYQTVVPVKNPRLWTAETPSLYRLQLTLSADGKPLQTFQQRIGLRQISIVDGVLQLNGRPIKLRGVDRHDETPVHGRAVTEADERRDLELMKRANINFVRTSHYPPRRCFIELCDEMGIYVMDEVPIGFGDEHDNDPAYRNNIMARVKATITRDKNHPSVIIWSIGNENPVTDLLLDAGRLAKKLDPTRPICYPMTPTVFRRNYGKLPKFVDLYDEHYPTDAQLHELPKTLDRPMIFSEYAHANGLAAGAIQTQWAIMQATPQFAGGAIWCFQDQGLLRTSPKPLDRNIPTEYLALAKFHYYDNDLPKFHTLEGSMNVWLDQHRYYDTHGPNGCDGIVYSDRIPQPDYWEVRKVYAPVQIPETSAAVKPGAQEIAVTAENRYDFRALTGIKLAWSLQCNGAKLQKGEVPLHAASHDTETVRLPVNIPANAASDILTLNLRCIDKTGLQINERAIKLDLPDANRDAWLASLPATGKPTVTNTKNEVKIACPQWVLTVERATGALTIRSSTGRMLVDGIYPHSGRKLTMAEVRALPRSHAWRMLILTNVDTPDIKVTEDGSNVLLAVSGRYPRPGAPGQAFVGGYRVKITPNGVIAIHYDYAPTNATGELSEAGLSVMTPANLAEFRWIGQGPYAGYPGKDRLNEFGLFHLNRRDLRFQGNRRETELALLTTARGAGVALATTPGNVAVERDGDQILLSQNAVLSGLGNKFALPAVMVNAAKTPHIAGSFTLVPLDNRWPAQLTRWFGQPSAAKNVFHPFYDSYDQ